MKADCAFLQSIQGGRLKLPPSLDRDRSLTLAAYESLRLKAKGFLPISERNKKRPQNEKPELSSLMKLEPFPDARHNKLQFLATQKKGSHSIDGDGRDDRSPQQSDFLRRNAGLLPLSLKRDD